MISVIMPVYNSEKYLAKAINSILNQTHKNLEFIIIDDGSTDTSLEIIKSYSDKRIVLIRNKTNKGVVKSLNHGLKISKGEYIARMDADDISLPTRLEKQISFLTKFPENKMVGTSTKFIYGDDDKPTINQPYLCFNYEEIKLWSLFYSPFVHPSILIKSDIIKELQYSEDFKAAEDYHLWFRMIKKYKVANLEEVLLHYRIHPNKTGWVKKEYQLSSVRKIFQLQFDEFGIKFNSEDLETHLWLSNSFNHLSLLTKQIYSIENWLLRLGKMLKTNSIFELDDAKIDAKIKEIWYLTALKEKQNGLSTFFIYYKSKLRLSRVNKNLILLLHCIGNEDFFRPLYKFSTSFLRKLIYRSSHFSSNSSAKIL